MVVVYERSGGFAGMMQSLRLEGGLLRASEKGHVRAERPLTTEEAEHVAGLLERMTGAAPPEEEPGVAGSSDVFTVLLSIEGEPQPRVSLATPTLPILGAGEPWDEILGWFDRTLTAELRTAKPDAPQILSARELLEGK